MPLIRGNDIIYLSQTHHCRSPLVQVSPCDLIKRLVSIRLQGFICYLNGDGEPLSTKFVIA